MSKQKIEEWLVENTGYFYDDNRITMDETIGIIHQFTQDQSGWNEERTVLLQAVRFYAEQASYNGSWKSGDPFHVMEDKGQVARNAIFKVSLPPTEAAKCINDLNIERNNVLMSAKVKEIILINALKSMHKMNLKMVREYNNRVSPWESMDEEHLHDVAVILERFSK